MKLSLRSSVLSPSVQMAAIATSSAIVAPTALNAAVSQKTSTLKSVSVAPSTFFSGNTEFAAKTVSNGSRVSAMLVWNPFNNTKYETLSYLPPLSDAATAKQIQYMLLKGWIPCIEFEEDGAIKRTYNSGPGYYDGRYWTLWKLPLFGCTDAYQVLRELDEARKAYPKSFIRVIGFDNIQQVQCMSFIVHKPQLTSRWKLFERTNV